MEGTARTNPVVCDAMNKTGEGYLHGGSRNCGPAHGRALSDRAACEFLTTAQFSASQLNLNTNQVNFDRGGLLEGIDFCAPVYAGLCTLGKCLPVPSAIQF